MFTNCVLVTQFSIGGTTRERKKRTGDGSLSKKVGVMPIAPGAYRGLWLCDSLSIPAAPA